MYRFVAHYPNFEKEQVTNMGWLLISIFRYERTGFVQMKRMFESVNDVQKRNIKRKLKDFLIKILEK